MVSLFSLLYLCTQCRVSRSLTLESGAPAGPSQTGAVCRWFRELDLFVCVRVRPVEELPLGVCSGVFRTLIGRQLFEKPC